jgi:hypothetical protein
MQVLTRKRRPPLIRDAALGVAAGAAGTAAMTGYQELAVRLRSDGGGSTEPQTDEERWEEAPAPAKLVRKASLAAADRDIDPDRIPLLTNVMHWLYGSAWGAGFALVHRRIRGPVAAEGVAFGTAIWALGYAQLVPLGIYKPPWRYSAKALAKDLSYHLVYGAATAAAFEGVRRAADR